MVNDVTIEFFQKQKDEASISAKIQVMRNLITYFEDILKLPEAIAIEKIKNQINILKEECSNLERKSMEILK